MPFSDESLDRQARSGRRRNQRQLAQAAQRHVERARYGRGGERQHVHFGAQGLQALLVAHAEAVFLVDDDQSQIAKACVGMQQPVGGNHNVHRAALQSFQHRAALATGAEARQRFDAHRPVGKAIAEALQMLLSQQRGGNQHRDLLAGLHCHEGRSHRHFGLAEADVAAHDPIHRRGGPHILEHLSDGFRLIGGFLEREAIGKGLIFEFAGAQARRLMRGAARMQIQQFGGNIAHRLGGAPSGLGPLIGAELVQGCALGCATGVTVDEMQRMHRHIHPIAVAIFEHQEFPALLADFHELQIDVAADTISLVYHRRARLEALQIAQDGGRIGRCALAAAPLLTGACAKQLRFAQQHQRWRIQRHAADVFGDADRQRGIAAHSELLPALQHARFAVRGR